MRATTRQKGVCGPAGWTSPVLIVSLIALATLVALVGVGKHAQATTLESLSLAALADRAELVFHGQVIQTESYWEDGLIVTDTTVEVRECLSGPCENSHVVRQIGGTVGEHSMVVAGLRTFEVGDELVMFVAHHRGNGRLMPTGQCQGIIAVRDNQLFRNVSDVELIDLSAGPDAAQAATVGIPATLDELRDRLSTP